MDAKDDNNSQLPKSKIGNHNVYQCDLETLLHAEKINDNVINAYLELQLMHKGNKNFHFFNTHFFSKLSGKGYGKIARWTRKIDIFSLEKLFVPIHLHNEEHWCTGCGLQD